MHNTGFVCLAVQGGEVQNGQGEEGRRSFERGSDGEGIGNSSEGMMHSTEGTIANGAVLEGGMGGMGMSNGGTSLSGAEVDTGDLHLCRQYCLKARFSFFDLYQELAVAAYLYDEAAMSFLDISMCEQFEFSLGTQYGDEWRYEEIIGGEAQVDDHAYEYLPSRRRFARTRDRGERRVQRRGSRRASCPTYRWRRCPPKRIQPALPEDMQGSPPVCRLRDTAKNTACNTHLPSGK